MVLIGNEENTSVVAHLRGLRISPKKVIGCVKSLRQRCHRRQERSKKNKLRQHRCTTYMSIPRSYHVLDSLSKRTSVPLKKLIESAVANALANRKVGTDRLFIEKISVGPAFILKRYHTRAKGMSNRIVHRYSNITVSLGIKK